jgi:hypothetical protein
MYALGPKELLVMPHSGHLTLTAAGLEKRMHAQLWLRDIGLFDRQSSLLVTA